jgi:GT2 family glycosyltransferase
LDLRKSISVIIPNYNGRSLLKEYLPSTLEVLTSAGMPYEIIVVDDASTDDSAAFIQSYYPQIALIVNPENKGFSYSCNRGIAIAKHELILLLNSDVKLTPGYFDQQWKYFLRWDTFGVMGRIIDMEGDHIQDAARVPKFNGMKLKTDYFFYSDDSDARSYTFYLSGANALINAEKLRALGGFYELFSPFYCEDMELSIRAWRMKWKCYYEHSAICRHQVSASTKNYNTAKWVKSIYFRNRFYLHAIHLNGFPLFLWYLQITFVDLLPKMLIGQTWIWKSYSELFASRKEIKRFKQKLNELFEKNESYVTVFNVVNKIRRYVKNKDYTRFSP